MHGRLLLAKYAQVSRTSLGSTGPARDSREATPLLLVTQRAVVSPRPAIELHKSWNHDSDDCWWKNLRASASAITLGVHTESKTRARSSDRELLICMGASLEFDGRSGAGGDVGDREGRRVSVLRMVGVDHHRGPGYLKVTDGGREMPK